MSRVVLAHISRHSPPWLILGVRQREMNPLRQKFRWPLWPLPALILASLLMFPSISADYQRLFDRVMYAGILMCSSRYLWAWRRTGERIDWMIYSLAILFMPILATVLVSGILWFTT